MDQNPAQPAPPQDVVEHVRSEVERANDAGDEERLEILEGLHAGLESELSKPDIEGGERSA